MPHQVRPYGWEGFRAYNMTYLMRAKGLNFQGAEAIYVLNADCLMVIELKRLRTGDLEIGMADLSEEYPCNLRPERLYPQRDCQVLC